MKILTTTVCAVLVLVAFTLGEAAAKDVMVEHDYGKKHTWRPLVDFPEFFPSLAFLDELEALAVDNPAAAETLPWQEERLSRLCRDPIVFAVEEMLVPQREIMTKGCLIFAMADVLRETRATTPPGIEILKFANRRFKVKSGVTIITLNGRFIDNLSRPNLAPVVSEAQGEAAYCVTENKKTTCSLPDVREPLCRVVRYGRDKMVVEGLDRAPLSACEHYVQGKELHGENAVSGDVCYIKTDGDGKVVSDCSTFNVIDHRVGEGDVFSQFGDSVIIGTQNDNYYVAPENVNLLFIEAVPGATGSAKVIGSGENTRLIIKQADVEW